VDLILCSPIGNLLAVSSWAFEKSKIWNGVLLETCHKKMIMLISFMRLMLSILPPFLFFEHVTHPMWMKKSNKI
jgi:hypothetical protein